MKIWITRITRMDDEARQLQTFVLLLLLLQIITSNHIHDDDRNSDDANEGNHNNNNNDKDNKDDNGNNNDEMMKLNATVASLCFAVADNHIRSECDIRKNFDTNEYLNIFVSNKFTRTNIRIYSYKKFDTNECPNKYLY